jgi:hypothetical protein
VTIGSRRHTGLSTRAHLISDQLKHQPHIRGSIPVLLPVRTMTSRVRWTEEPFSSFVEQTYTADLCSIEVALENMYCIQKYSEGQFS